MACRVLHIDLDGFTEEEASTEEEDDIEMSEPKVIDSRNTNDSIKTLKKCFDGQQSDKNICKKSVDIISKMSIKLGEEFGDNKTKDIRNVINKDMKEQIFETFKSKPKCSSEEVFGQNMPSTSKMEPKYATIDHNLTETCDELPKKTVLMKDQSTHTRYYYSPRSSNSSANLSKGKPSVNSNEEKKISDTNSTIKKKYWSVVCRNCFDIFESRKEFSIHFNEIHSNKDLAKIYYKYESKYKDQNQTNKALKSRLPPPVPHTTSRSTHSKEKKKKKNIPKRKHKKSIPSASIVSDVTANEVNDSQPSPLFPHYKVVQKCRICSFTPLINSLEAIKEHVLNEHHCNTEDIPTCYTAFLVKLTPKNS